ncbi:MAG TPA: protein phosphatase 2C domain-containing protein, partial [Polyangiales bacterium]
MPTDPVIRFWPKTDVGRVRDVNEDSYLVDGALNLFVVADGMGGHAAGEIASNVAVHAVRETLVREREMLDKFERGIDTATRKDVLRLMEL